MFPKGFLQQDAVEKEESCLEDIQKFQSVHHHLQEDWYVKGEYRYFNITGQLMCYNVKTINLFEEEECPSYIKRYNNHAIQYFNRFLEVAAGFYKAAAQGSPQQKEIKKMYPSWRVYKAFADIKEPEYEIVKSNPKDYDYYHNYRC